MRRIAIVGSGISGLGVAHRLAGVAQVTLFEAADYLGGHTHTVDVTLDGHTHGVDTGFLVLNERTYPNLLHLFDELGVELAKSDMSFSVQVPSERLEWSGANLAGLLAQPVNMLRPRFWHMLADVLRFNRLATAMALQTSPAATAEGPSIEAFLDTHRFTKAFRDWYFLPMIGSIWSCPTEQMLRFPVATMIRFCHNHGLLQIADRPQWYTVRGGARRYVERMRRSIDDIRLATPVRQIRRLPDAGVEVTTDRAREHFDDVVLACHSDQALALLADPSAAEREVLGAIRYQPNRAVLHTDQALLPRRRAAWAAWNYERSADSVGKDPGVCLHYLLNRLQPLPFTTPLVVSLNPSRPPRADLVLGEYGYAHPVFDSAAIAAQLRLPALQGRRHTWYCGAWTRYGFHEDGLLSAYAVADVLEPACRAGAAAPAAAFEAAA